MVLLKTNTKEWELQVCCQSATISFLILSVSEYCWRKTVLVFLWNIFILEAWCFNLFLLSTLFSAVEPTAKHAILVCQTFRLFTTILILVCRIRTLMRFVYKFTIFLDPNTSMSHCFGELCSDQLYTSNGF